MNEYKYEDIYKGQIEEFNFEITEEKMQQFYWLTGDNNPLHMDLSYAKEKGYNEVVVYGLLTTSALSTLAGVYLPGKYSLIHSVEINYAKPVFLSSSPLRVKGEVIEKDDRFKMITVKVSIFDKNRVKVCRGVMQIGVTC